MISRKSKPRYIIFSAPSGSGKSTLVSHMMQKGLPLAFSVSATSRAPREGESHAKHYYFLTPEDFKEKIENDDFVEWEEVYEQVYYGTLKSELTRILELGKIPIFDVDVVGGVQLKKILGDNALSVFIQVSSIKELEKRLRHRATDSEESIKKRLEKAAYEMSFAPQFDQVIINDDLDTAVEETYALLKDFIDD